MGHKGYIDYDMQKIFELKQLYENTLQYISNDLTPLNLNSNKQIIRFFNEELGLPAKDAKIKTLEYFLNQFNSDSMQFNVIYGIITYLKLKYSLRNYIDCIIRHQTNGRITLREMDGEYKMPNRQPLTGNPEIIACEKESKDGSIN